MELANNEEKSARKWLLFRRAAWYSFITPFMMAFVIYACFVVTDKMDNAQFKQFGWVHLAILIILASSFLSGLVCLHALSAGKRKIALIGFLGLILSAAAIFGEFVAAILSSLGRNC